MQGLPVEILASILERYAEKYFFSCWLTLREVLPIMQVSRLWREVACRFLGKRIVQVAETDSSPEALRTSSIKFWRNFFGVSELLLIRQATKSARKALVHSRLLPRCNLDIGLPLNEGPWFAETVFQSVVDYDLFDKRYPNLHRILDIVRTLSDEQLRKLSFRSSFHTWMWFLGKVHLIDLRRLTSDSLSAMADYERRHPYMPRYAAELAACWIQRSPGRGLSECTVRRLAKVGAKQIAPFVVMGDTPSFDILCTGSVEAIDMLRYRSWHYGRYWVLLHYARKNYVDAIKYYLDEIKRKLKTFRRDLVSWPFRDGISDRLKHAITIARGRKFHEAVGLLEECQQILESNLAKKQQRLYRYIHQNDGDGCLAFDSQ